MSSPRVSEQTPAGRGGISVLAVEGPGALAGVRALAPGLRADETGPQLARLADAGEVLEEALVLVEGPERVELHVHGSPPLVRRLMALLGGAATPEAEPTIPGAEPTIEDRAHQLLSAAPCEAGARILLDQAEGALRRELEELARLAGAGSPELGARVAALLEAGRVAAFALRPARVVLAGPVNAGKSTLFNALYGGRRVVTSGERGTTRDVVAERVRLGAWPVDLVDTAGDREVPAARSRPAALWREVELAGQGAGRRERARADLVLWLLPADDPGPPPPGPSTEEGGGRAGGPPLVVLHSRSDLAHPPGPPARSLSALRGPARAAALVTEVFLEVLRLPADPWNPGRPVPFDREVRGVLEALASPSGVAGRGPRERAELLEALLVR